MKTVTVVIVCLYFLNANGDCERNTVKSKDCSTTLDKPLILTSFLKQGNIEEAREAAEVKLSDFKNTKSYAAYFTVNERYNSNLFFWFFPSQTDYVNAPVMLWIEGGPGSTTLLDVFLGNGPFKLTPESVVELNEYSWTRNHSVIFIDNPAGAGYSFTDEGGYARNETIIGAQLYEALLQFFQLFSELQENEFFIGGISYAGKYVPAIAYTIHRNNPPAKQKINLQGIAIGNGWIDPEHQLGYSNYLYQVGLIDSNDRGQIKKIEDNLVKYIKNKEWFKVFNEFDNLFYRNDSFYYNTTGFKNYHGYLAPSQQNLMKLFDIFKQYIHSKLVRKTLHVGNTTYYGKSSKVLQSLKSDFSQSVAPWLSELLSHYRVLLYNGQLDVICAYPLTVNFVSNLNFSAAKEYRTAARHKWYVREDLAGYIKNAGNLTEVLVRNASHCVHCDQPKWVLDLFTKFTHKIPFY